VDLAIVGAGPAGCSAAVMAASLGLTVTVFDGAGVGGRVARIAWIDNLLGQPAPGPELVAGWARHLRAAGAEVVAQDVTAVDAVDGAWSIGTAAGRHVTAAGLIVAAGMRDRRLADHPLVTGVAAGFTDVFVDVAIHDRLLTEDDVVVIGCDRPIVTFARSVGGARPRGRVRIVALPEKRYVLDTWPQDWPIEVVEASAVRSVDSPGEVEVVTDAGDVLRMPASLVVTNVGGTPNSGLFAGVLGVGAGGYLRSHPGGDGLPFVRAVGDVVDPDQQRVAVAIGAGAQAALDFFRTTDRFGR
jgi:thioredoxin reductase (NADPH)